MLWECENKRINDPFGKESEEIMEKQLKRGYSNEIILYGIITEIFRTDYNVSIGIAVQQKDVRMQNDYPKILFYDSENGKINIDTLAENFDAYIWVKIEDTYRLFPDTQILRNEYLIRQL